MLSNSSVKLSYDKKKNQVFQSVTKLRRSSTERRRSASPGLSNGIARWANTSKAVQKPLKSRLSGNCSLNSLWHSYTFRCGCTRCLKDCMVNLIEIITFTQMWLTNVIDKCDWFVFPNFGDGPCGFAAKNYGKVHVSTWLDQHLADFFGTVQTLKWLLLALQIQHERTRYILVYTVIY